MKAVFLDRDGTITVGTPRYERIDSVDKVELLPDSLEALRLLAKLDYGVFLVTNQMSLAEKRINWDEFAVINQKILDLIAPSGVKVLKTYVCPHDEAANCDCRKPKPKLLLDAAKEFDVDLQQSWMIGDRPSDVMCGVNAGAKGILVKTGDPNATSDEAAFTASTLVEAIQYIADHMSDS